MTSDVTLATSDLNTRSIYGALATPPITLGGTSWQAVDPAGVEWICEDLDGWANLPGNDLGVVDRVFDHGGWAGDGWYHPRVLTFTGVLAGPTRATLQAAMHTLRAMHAQALRSGVVLSIDEMDDERRLGVRAASRAMKVSYVTPTAVRVEFDLVAPWPVKQGRGHEELTGGMQRGQGRTYPRPDERGWWSYGPAGRSGNILAVNGGNAPARPRLLFEGPTRNPRVIAAGQSRRLEFAVTLGAFDRLTVDADSRAVLLNGSTNRRSVLSGQSAWFDLEPGANLLQYRSDGNTGTMTVTWTDGWW